MSVSAQNVEVQLPPGAEAITSYRTQKDPAGMTTVYIGDIYAEGEITLLFRSAPSFGPLRIKGTDMATLNRMDMIVEPTILSAGQDIPLSLILAEYRQETADVLKRLTQTGNLSVLRPEIDRLIEKIQEDDRIRQHPLRPILLEDLTNALRITQRNTSLTREEAVEAYQHSAYISMTRGLRAPTNVVPAAPRRNRRAARSPVMPDVVASAVPMEEDPDIPPPAPMLSPFANRFQTQIATVMRTMSTQPPSSEGSQ
jgi:hypothetical protein